MEKRFNPWIIAAIVIGCLCGAVIVLYVLMMVSANSVSNDYTDIDDEVISGNSAENKAIDFTDMSSADSYIEFDLDDFKTSYDKDVKDEEEADDEEDDDEEDDDNEEGDYIIPDSDKRELSEDDLEKLSAKELTYARNEIYARHGRKFQSSELQEYFSSKDWYKEDEDFDDHDLNGIERENAEFISKYQKDHDLTYKAG